MMKKLEKILQELEDPNYKGGSWALSPNASSLEKNKYSLCEKIVSYKQDNNLSLKEIAKKIQLSPAEADGILHYHLDYFTLDRLVVYASKLLTPQQEIKIVIENKKFSSKKTSLRV